MEELLAKYTYGLPPLKFRAKLQRRKAAEFPAGAEQAAHSLSAAAEAAAGGEVARGLPIVVGTLAGSVTDEELLAAAWEAEQALDRTQTTTANVQPAAMPAAAEAADAAAEQPGGLSLSLPHVIGTCDG